MTVAQQTYDKDQWSPDDVKTLRACWEEFQRRGGEILGGPAADAWVVVASAEAHQLGVQFVGVVSVVTWRAIWK
jgi:hypothetical protein